MEGTNYAVNCGNGGFRRSGGGTRTHNLRVNSPPLCRIELPRKEWSQTPENTGLPGQV